MSDPLVAESGQLRRPVESAQANAVLHRFKRFIERASGCRIYRNSRLHGFSCYSDLDRRFGRSNFKVVFDVGANVGQSAMTYLEEFPRADIYSFEPVKATYQALVSATKGQPRIHTYNLGIAGESGALVINVNPNSVYSSIRTRRSEDQPETIQVVTLTAFVEEHRINCIDFLKIDVEGYDLEVLSGAADLLQEQRIHFILSECQPGVHSNEMVSFSSLVDLLSKFGYRAYGVYEQQPDWDGSNVLLFWNALFICDRLIRPGAKL